MKYFFRICGGLVIVMSLIFVACNKEEKTVKLPSEDISISPEISIKLSADKSELDLDSTNAENTDVLKLWWNVQKGGSDIKVNYVLQVDSLAGQFTYPLNIPMGNDSMINMTSKELNDIAVGMGLSDDRKGEIQLRVKAGIKNLKSPLYADTTIFSDIVKLMVKPYPEEANSTIFPAPDSLYIIGDATPSGNWDPNVNADKQGFIMLDNGSFGIIIKLKAGKHYAFIPRNGKTDTTYSLLETSSTPNESGEFILNGKENIPSPDQDGLYKIIVLPDSHTYEVTSVDPSKIPEGLLMVGAVTKDMAWGLTASTKYMTKINAYIFEVILEVKPGSGNSMLLMDINNVGWNAKIGIPDASFADANVSGPFEQGSGVADFPTPNKDGGEYKFTVNYLTHTYKFTKL